MAVDIHALNLLRFAARENRFGRTAMIGRQNLKVTRKQIKKLLNLEQEQHFGPFCEELLTAHFGATLVHSYDKSDFEGATHVADLNKPLHVDSEYDTIIDCGSLEHIYNAPQALKNISLMCGEGGRILHALPTNNYCGHGFWQFSPELFFSLYSKPNGYSDTRVFLAGVTDDFRWYEVKQPRNGQRTEVTSCTKLLVLVSTRKVSPFLHDDVQQSDYIHIWNQDAALRPQPPADPSVNTYLKEILGTTSLLSLARIAYDRLTAKSTLSGRNHRLIRRSLPDFIERGE